MIRFVSTHPARTALTLAAGVLAFAGCGTTRSSDSLRTATEQLLISDAVDRAVQAIDFHPLRGQTVYLDDSKLQDVVDKNYLISTLRQHLLASGCTLKDSRHEADFIVEARAGAVGTDRNDLLFGIPATNVPQIVSMPGVPTAIPEVPLAKRRDQRGVAKISMFAYHRESGRPVWQSGLASSESSSNDVWLFGAGPFQYGSILHDQRGVHVARRGDVKTERDAQPHQAGEKVRLAEQAVFASPEKLVKQYRRLPAASAVAAVDAGKAPPPAPAAGAHPAAPPVPRAPYPPAGVAAQTQLPGLAATAIRQRVAPLLTGDITQAMLLKNMAPKTVELTLPTRETDSIALPQPRFDSL
jgi:hypothetical protein